MSNLFKNIGFSYAFLGMVFFPFPLLCFPQHQQWVQWLFGDLVKWIKSLLLIPTDYHAFTSDSSSLYVLMLFLWIPAVFIGQISQRLDKKHLQKFQKWVVIMLAFYLAFQLLNYGINKALGNQFYFPEPNILYTPLGQLEKDILFWSVLGAAPTFGWILGGIQCFAALLFIMERTRWLAFGLSLLIFLNIFVINLCFDISVKLFTFFLCLLSWMGCVYYQKEYQKLYHLMIKLSKGFRKPAVGFGWIKLVFVLLMFYEIIAPLNQNQDPFSSLKGAYEIQQIDSDERSENLRFKRFFIHSKGYLIFQTHKDEMIDYQMINKINQFLLVKNEEQIPFEIKVNSKGKTTLELMSHEEKTQIFATKTPLETLPIKRSIFHWMVDE